MENEIDSLLTEVDNSMSLYNPQSLLSRLNRNETDSVDGFIAECIRTARRISEQSDGAYDITVKPLTAAYGFTGDVPVQNPDVDSLLKLVGYDKIAVENGRLRKADPRMQIDLNSIAQGATSDYIAAYFEKLGIEEYMIEVGGEIFCRGLNAKGKPWVVGIDRPKEGNFTPGARPAGQNLAERERTRHIGQLPQVPHRLERPKDRPYGRSENGAAVTSDLLSATVVAETSAEADAYGTALMVMGLERGKEFLAAHPEIQAYLIYSDEQGRFQTYVTPELGRTIAR